MPEAGETREEILSALAAAGLPMSASQLARLHRAGAISAPRTTSLGRGRGRESVYPVGTKDQAMRLACLSPQERRVPQRAWLSWWLDGGRMSEAARELLRASAGRLDAMLENVRALARGEAVEIGGEWLTLDDIYRASEHERLDGVLGRARSRTGKVRFSSVMAFLVELTAGEFRAFPEDRLLGTRETEAQLIEVALGLSRARTDALAGAEPWLQGDLEGDFARLSSRIQTISFQDAAEAPDDQLNIARIEVSALSEVVTIAAVCSDAIFGRGAFSYRDLADVLKLDDYEAQMFAVLAWSQMRRDRALREGMVEVTSARGQAREMQKAIETLAFLREHVPSLSDLLTPARVADALRTRGGEAYTAELARAYQAHTSEIEAALQMKADAAPRD